MPQVYTGKPQLNREVNRRLILDRIRRNGEVSRAELAKLTHIRPPTVSAVVKELMTEGLVEETGAGAPSGGRAPRMVALRREHPRALGFEVSETEILAGVADLAGDLRSRMRIAFTPTDPQGTVQRIRHIGSELLAEHRLDWSDIQGVGVALPGHLNSADGVVRWSQPFGWKNVPLRALCEACWGVPTDVVNDSMAGGMAAHFLGPAREVRNFVYFYLRFLDASHGVVGLGSGIIINGEPYHGEFGAAGEITTPIAHPLLDARDERGNPFPGVASFIDAFKQGQDSAVAALRRATDEFAVLALHAINLIEPGMIVIGSDVDDLQGAVLDGVRRTVEEHRLSYGPGCTEIVGSNLGEFSVVRGAVVPTLQRVFRMPRWT
jgi:N-acetylglucosamine repressor